MKENKIILSHGSGGKLMYSLIENIFLKNFKNDILEKLYDSGIIEFENFDLCFTTDSYTVDPIFFKGGDIGKLSICGTINDLAVTGAVPLFLSSGFIIEEGFEIENLEKIVKSMEEISRQAKVKIITGDTKVVERGKIDKIFINTSGVGIKDKRIKLGIEKIKEGDVVIINGEIAEHGLSVLISRDTFKIDADIKSDCAPLSELISEILKETDKIKFMRDPTRGGISATLNEIVKNRNFGIVIYEKKIPIKQDVKAICEILGFDPLNIANEGKVVVICDKKEGERVVKKMRKNKYGEKAEIIGEVVKKPEGKVLIETLTGSLRIVDMPIGEQFPRIC
ncbi:MAG: hydrogenase expression/formation protein HypE [Candidatus Omnitrophica bacterium]|nr:hydrogenase expression/formation protein HypE [Candidatus Omnitrophota bacterium]MCM8809316.1 hydrogenase expression/formation protein HypE [Candidatus Omnitrophota bacterium]MCM8833684.1 hydrogenase expression/formation protein HypE [Candidatus Omnitrophota bacterium]